LYTGARARALTEASETFRFARAHIGHADRFLHHSKQLHLKNAENSIHFWAKSEKTKTNFRRLGGCVKLSSSPQEKRYDEIRRFCFWFKKQSLKIFKKKWVLTKKNFFCHFFSSIFFLYFEKKYFKV